METEDDDVLDVSSNDLQEHNVVATSSGQSSRNSFSIVHEKTSSADVVFSKWCPNMDLLAIVNAGDTITIRRLSWQELFVIHIKYKNFPDTVHVQTISINKTESASKVQSNITALAWRPDGKMIAIGLANGLIIFYSIESRRQISEYRHHVSRITTLEWIDGNDPSSFTKAFRNTDTGAGTSADPNDAIIHPHPHIGSNKISISFVDRTVRFFKPLPQIPGTFLTFMSISLSQVPNIVLCLT
jgi:WD40 repeat protein